MIYAVAAALGVSATGSRLITDVESYLRPRRLLMVLDNFGQVMAPAPNRPNPRLAPGSVRGTAMIPGPLKFSKQPRRPLSYPSRLRATVPGCSTSPRIRQKIANAAENAVMCACNGPDRRDCSIQNEQRAQLMSPVDYALRSARARIRGGGGIAGSAACLVPPDST